MPGADTLEIKAELPPLQPGADGAIRVGNTRITLDVVVDAFEQGLALEEIVNEFDSLERSDVYSAIAFYLRHKPEVQSYLEGRRQAEEQLRKKIEASGGTPTQDQMDAIKGQWKSLLRDRNAKASD
jgi:uncharacterized protein (DUF433 family)